MPPQGTARSDYFKQLYIIFAALLMGMVIFAFVAWSQSGRTGGGDEGLSRIFRIIAPILALSCLVAGQVVFKWKMNSIGLAAGLDEKLMAYRAALIVKLALIEGPALFASVAFLITGDSVFLGMAGVLILFFLYNKPSKSRLVQDLGLTAEEARVVEEEM